MQKFVDYIPVWLRRVLCFILPFVYFYVGSIYKIGILANTSQNVFALIFGAVFLPLLIGYTVYLFAPHQKVKSAKIALGIWCFLGVMVSVLLLTITIPDGSKNWDISGVYIMGSFHLLATIIVWIILNKYRSQDAPPKYRLDKLLGKLSPSLRWGLYVLLPLSQLVGIGTASKIVPWAFPYAGVAELFLATLIPHFYVTVLPYYLAPKKKTNALLCWMAVWQVFLTVCITYFYLNFSSVFPGSTAAFDSIIMQLFGALALNLVLCAVFYWILYRKEKRKAHELHVVALSHESPSPLAK